MIMEQLSVFDWMPEACPSKKPKLTTRQIEDREILRGSGFEGGKTRIYNYFIENHSIKERIDFLKHEYGNGGWSLVDGGWCNHDANGIDINFNEPIEKTKDVHIGWLMVAKRIEELILIGRYQPDVCKFSYHTCNKYNLWDVADYLDDVECPHTCCRICDQNMCGARCNGSEELEGEYKEGGKEE